LRFTDLTLAIRRVLPAARRAADFVIVLAHEGAGCDSGGPCTGEILDAAKRLDSGSVDLIVAGHTHRRVNTVVNGIPVVEAGSSGGTIAVVDFVRAGSRGREVHARLETPFADRVAPDRTLAGDIGRVQHAADSITSRPIVTLKLPLPKQEGETSLGRLIADAYRNIGRADVGLVNNGGIRTGLPGGQVTYGQLFEVEPFQNRLVRVTVSGAVLREALEHALAGSAPDAHVSGVQVWYDPRRPEGKRIHQVRMFNGKSLDAKRTYTLAVPDFLAEGGGGYAMLTGAPRVDAGVVDLDALIGYLGVIHQPVEPPTDERFHNEGAHR